MSNPHARYDAKLIDMMVADGMAKAIKHPDGTAYLITYDEGKVLVKPHQIFVADTAAFTILVDGVEFDDNAAEADLAARDFAEDLLRQSALTGASIGELTDGEYEIVDGKAVHVDVLYPVKRGSARIELPVGSYNGGL